ncbi:hypothetical protein F0L17_14415 [Streptomyces sp. TRM43335]|uniref:Uncharacterized protein n=1 Tax=Streptomyces taklimakanensis TaxID=2569853 RepID=A0A6G2BDC1_9ACTN|nr:hypothetical protein [Streptomyces taklimakanensis]MTE20281.1 hypothetical protein [Streptomyces taklimakanensis]
MAGTVGSAGGSGGPERELLLLCDTDPTGAVTPFLRRYTVAGDGTATAADTALDGTTPYTPAGTVGVCETTDPCTRTVIERCGCDDADGDGTGEVPYTELWAIDPCDGQAPVLLGTYRDGDFTQPYTPVAPVECTASSQDPAPVLTGARRLTGDTVLDVAGLYPGLQSVTLTVVAGEGTATTSDGTVTVPAGATLTWSVTTDRDEALAAWSGGSTGAGSDVLLHYTYKGA